MVKTPVPMYLAVLQAIGCEVDANDLVSFIMPNGDRTPLLVEGKRLVIPTPEMLGRINSEQHVAYHPLCEMIMLNESQVHSKIRNAINIKTMFVISTLMLELMDVAISTDKGILSKSPYYDLFELMGEATPRTQKAVKSLVETIKPSGADKRLLNFISRRVGKLNDKDYRRITAVSFPIMEEFDPKKPADRIFDVKMAKKDKELIFKLLKYIVPGIDGDNVYSSGSESMIAPNFDSLVKAYANLMTDVNKISWKYKDVLANVGFLTADLGYLDLIKDLDQYKGFLPVLDGNQGCENLNTQNSINNQITVGSLTPTAIGRDNVPVATGALSSPSVSNTVKTTITTTTTNSPAATKAAVGTVGLAKPTGMMGGINPFMGAMVGNVANNLMGGMGLGMMGGFGGFPTVGASNANSGFVHPTGTVGLNPMAGMMNQGMNMGMMGNFNPMAGMMGNGMMGNPMMNGMMGGFGAQLPPGCVMGRSGNVVNLTTATIEELEKELPPDLFSQVYAQRMMQAQMGAAQAAFNNVVSGIGFKTA